MNIPKLIAFLISLIVLYFAYDYLVKLEDCVCAQQLGVVSQADIKKLKYIELFMIVLLFLNYFIAFQKRLSIGIATLFTLLMIAVYVYFVVHVHRLYMNMPDTCDCSMKFPRYILYVQAILMSLALLMWVFVFIMIVMASVAISRVVPPGVASGPKRKLRTKK